ncbi:hypothetical protein PPL_08366 [Heterostelium album PN500]|uniref:MYND-type domain-containing protein n=1 Tax=Heterostelium pallidum (strain ATCC 26659 / Pp 5 / PN500) TaxID=670386 RepID=D3BHZ8_HETP5|nr:hypothetical protein PPL_08366 [Heterostelium album PN500]EFA78898.1 hypothetical protein PPL_08366 [Heterostelium album PN500]|eukprot:XP_020431022.1 hypothetical protein PPL_08366 [Heterostelium album PN500]
MVATLEQRYKHRYKVFISRFPVEEYKVASKRTLDLHHDLERILRVFRKIFYERWKKTHGKDYVENPEHGEKVTTGTSFDVIMGLESMKKINSGRTVDWDFKTWHNILSNYPWKNIPERQLIAQNADIGQFCSMMYQMFFWDDSKDKLKKRPCSHGCAHEEEFEVWDHTSKMRQMNMDVSLRIDKTMTTKDWNGIWRSFQQNDDNYQALPLYDDLTEMELSMAYKKEADEQMAKGNFVLAIHLLTLALDYRCVTEHYLAGLFEQRATCYVQWMENNKMIVKSFAKLAKRDIQRSIGIRPCHASSYSVLARCHDILSKHNKAAYFHKTALQLDPKNQALMDAKKRSEELKKKSPYAKPIDPMKIMPFVMSRGGLTTKEHMNVFTDLTEAELTTYYNVFEAAMGDGSKDRREHYDKSTEEFKKQTFYYSNDKEAIELFKKSVAEKSIHAECYVGVARQYLDGGPLCNSPDAKQKATDLLKIAIQKPFVLSTGYKINHGVGEAYLLLGKLALADEQSEQALAYLHKAIEFNDGCLTLSSAAFLLGTEYIKIGSPNIERGLAILRVAADKGSRKASVSLRDYYLQINGEDSPKTKYWTSYVKFPPKWEVVTPVVFPGSEIQKPLAKPSNARDKNIIKNFRDLLLKNAKNEVKISKSAKMTFESSYPPAHFKVEEYKVVGQRSIDAGPTSPFAGLFGAHITQCYEKCYLVGVVREPALCKGETFELLVQDVENVPVRIEVRGYNPRIFKIGSKYAFFAITTCQSEFDKANIHYTEYVAVGGIPLSDLICRACLKPCTSKCSKCPAPYCDRDCQALDWKDLDHKSLCGLKLYIEFIQRSIDQNIDQRHLAFLDSSNNIKDYYDNRKQLKPNFIEVIQTRNIMSEDIRRISNSNVNSL